ncbi:FdtA/QdtA family cupin domain-containing protein [Pseudomonadota bacterium]
MSRVQQLRVAEASSFQDGLGQLVAFEENTNLPVGIQRVFVVSGNYGAVRGKHAHKQLTQVLACVHGECKVTCDDGESRREFSLTGINQVLQIPPGIWAEQEYMVEGTVLMVLCDLPYDESDYIRNYQEFLQYREGMKL